MNNEIETIFLLLKSNNLLMIKRIGQMNREQNGKQQSQTTFKG